MILYPWWIQLDWILYPWWIELYWIWLSVLTALIIVFQGQPQNNVKEIRTKQVMMINETGGDVGDNNNGDMMLLTSHIIAFVRQCPMNECKRDGKHFSLCLAHVYKWWKLQKTSFLHTAQHKHYICFLSKQITSWGVETSISTQLFWWK